MLITQRLASNHPKNSLGFSLIELMIALVIAAVLAGIAIPSYINYVERSKMRSAQADLVAVTVNIENEYQRMLSYPVIDADDDLENRYNGWNATSEDFTISAISTAAGYTVTATGQNSLQGCTLTIDNENQRTAADCPQGNGGWI